MERETKEIVCPSGKVAVMKTYLTAGETRQLRNVYLNAVKSAPTGDETPSFDGLGDAMTKAEDLLIRIAVTSYDGSAENILDRLLNGNPTEGNEKDHAFLVEEVGKMNTAFTRAK